MHRPPRLAALILVLALSVLACGSGEDDGSAEAGDTTTSGPSSEGSDSPDTTGDTTGDSTDDSTGDTTGDTTGSTDPGTTEVPALPAGYEGYVSEQYAEGRTWLCHPDDADENVCHRDLDATVVAADGTLTVEPHERASEPAVDCFYVYPTISMDPGANSDFEPSETAEIRTILNQAARLSSTCELYAPVYRQRTLTALLGSEADPSTRDLAYGDVLDAWKHYLANDNGGRGVILVGHSQGAGLLGRLLAEEIEGEPLLADRLVAAYLLGSGIAVPDGQDVGGSFTSTPLCRQVTQTGCVVTYASFRSTAPPPENSLFGRPRDGAQGQVAACTNPAALDGGAAELSPYVSMDDTQPFADPADPRVGEITTPWVTYPGLLSAECVVRDGFSYLEVTVQADPADPRTDDIGGDLTPEWGLHLVDANLAMGDLETLAATQAEAFAASD